MQITGTHFNYFNVCHRKLWLFANGIQMEHTSDLVAEGNLIHETSYPQRSEKYEEVAIDGIKIDYYDAKNRVVHEIKKSDKIDEAHTWQVKYYIYVLERNGIDGVTGVLEYPTLRKTDKVELTDEDRRRIGGIEQQICLIVENEHCPACIHNRICKKCSYYDFCYADENEEM